MAELLKRGEEEGSQESTTHIDQRNEQSHAPLHLACTAGNMYVGVWSQQGVLDPVGVWSDSSIYMYSHVQYSKLGVSFCYVITFDGGKSHHECYSTVYTRVYQYVILHAHTWLKYWYAAFVFKDVCNEWSWYKSCA